MINFSAPCSQKKNRYIGTFSSYPHHQCCQLQNVVELTQLFRQLLLLHICNFLQFQKYRKLATLPIIHPQTVLFLHSSVCAFFKETSNFYRIDTFDTQEIREGKRKCHNFLNLYRQVKIGQIYFAAIFCNF